MLPKPYKLRIVELETRLQAQQQKGRREADEACASGKSAQEIVTIREASIHCEKELYAEIQMNQTDGLKFLAAKLGVRLCYDKDHWEEARPGELRYLSQKGSDDLSRRIREVISFNREGRNFWISVISLVISIVSAVVAGLAMAR
jgi:hypothetical protein